MISSVADFCHYFESIRRRTLAYIRTIPADGCDWSPADGELSCADIVRHLASAERMFVGVVAGGRWRYDGHAQPAAAGVAELIEHLGRQHALAIEQLRQLDDGVLREERPTLNGPPVKAWRLLMAMVEHEIHHRSQLAVYLRMQGVTPPQIYGLGVEDIIALTTE